MILLSQIIKILTFYTLVLKYYPNTTGVFPEGYKMPKISVEIPQHILDDLNEHIGDDKKFVNLSDSIRTACRKMLDMMDEIDRRHGRLKDLSKKKRRSR